MDSQGLVLDAVTVSHERRGDEVDARLRCRYQFTLPR